MATLQYITTISFQIPTYTILHYFSATEILLLISIIFQQQILFRSIFRILSLTQKTAVDLHSVGTVTIHDDRPGGGEYRSCQNVRVYHCIWLLFSSQHLLGVSIITSLNSKLWTGQTTLNTIEKITVWFHTHKKKRPHFSLIYVQMEYIGYWSQRR